MPNQAKPPLFITQNFDSLSLRALNELSDRLSPQDLTLARDRTYEMHGSAFRTICTQCHHVNVTYETPLAPALLLDPQPGETIPISDLPKCGGSEWKGSNRYGQCGGLLRPGVVWFGEIPERQGEIAKELNWTEMLLVIGTSSVVSIWE